MACTQFDIAQTARLEALLNVYLDAITQVVASPKIYRMDTGQGVQSVERHDLRHLQETYGLLYQQYLALRARCGNGGIVNVCPPANLPWEIIT